MIQPDLATFIIRHELKQNLCSYMRMILGTEKGLRHFVYPKSLVYSEVPNKHPWTDIIFLKKIRHGQPY